MVMLKLKEVQLSRQTKMKRVRPNICVYSLRMEIYSLNFYLCAEKGVPDFWLNAMKNNEVLAEEVC